MTLFKPTLAQIYLRELRTRLDETLVPMFTPDTTVEVGQIGYFDHGQFISTGSTVTSEFGIAVPVDVNPHSADWSFTSEGAVSLSADGSISAGGLDLLKGKLSFTRDRAVVAAFKGVFEKRAVWSQALNKQVWALYLSERLPASHGVVWTVRQAASGTVLVNRKAGTTVEFAADPKLLGGLLSIQGLGAGVTFTGGSQTSLQLSGPGFTPFVRVKGVHEFDYGTLVDVKGFEGSSEEVNDALVDTDVPEVSAKDAEGLADWDTLEGDS